MAVRLTVWFDDPFWVGVFERSSDGVLQVSRHVFGSEPKGEEVYALVLKHFTGLRFGGAAVDQEYGHRRINPKRLQRDVARQTAAIGVGTKAQQALQADLESKKMERKVLRREVREELKERQRALKEQKRKEKHKGH